MSSFTPAAPTQTSDAVAGRLGADRPGAADPFDIPVLRPSAGGTAERFAARFPQGHPVRVFFAALVLGFLVVAVLSIGVGELVKHALLPAAGIGSGDESVNVWLAAHRDPTRTDVSLVGSTVGGAPVLPILVGLIALGFASLRHWRLAAYVVFGLAVESALYRVTTLFVHRDRQGVVRLDHLPVDASYPSGHTAASVAVYSGLALLLTSRYTNGRLRIVAWTAAVLMTLFVAASRMYRGMHHPIDVAAGALLGMAALVIIVFACRAAAAAGPHTRRDRGRRA